MSEALSLLESPWWLIVISLSVPAFAGFIKGVVEFSENWPKFCLIIKPIANRIHYGVYGFWMDWFDRLSFAILAWLVGSSKPNPDNDGPDGAPASQARLLTTTMSGFGDRRHAATVLRVIGGGKTGTADIFVDAFVVAVMTARATVLLVRGIHAGSANATRLALLAMSRVAFYTKACERRPASFAVRAWLATAKAAICRSSAPVRSALFAVLRPLDEATLLKS